MKILVISQWFPYPPVNGAKQRAYHLIRGLSEKYEVDLLTFAQQPSEMQHVPEMLSICRNVSVVPAREFHPTRANALKALVSPRPRSSIECWSEPMARLVREHMNEHHFDAAIALTTAVGEYLAGCSIPRILDDDNVDAAYFRRLVELADGKLSKFRRKLTWVKLARHEAWLVENFDATTVVSADDRQELARLVPAAERRGTIHVAPNGVDLGLVNHVAPSVDSKSIISTGALTYSANLDGTVYFCDEILPRIRAEVPETSFSVTGGYNGVEIPKAILENATLTGFLDDIHTKLSESAALVVPLRIGGGTRLKILEAMALGTPVVSTSLGAAGLEVTHKENILIADQPEEFAKCVLQLMKDPDLRAAISKKAREHVVNEFGWQRPVQTFDEIIRSIAKQGNHT